jgi:hypothetical protein
MATITIDIPEERLKLLSQRAEALGISTEDLLRLSIAELIMRPAPDVQQAIDYIVQKHADLYRRLA